MSWLQRYRIWHYVANSLWIFPVVGMVVAMANSLGCCTGSSWRSAGNRISIRTPCAPCWGPWRRRCSRSLSLSASALLVAVQLASAQLTPRIIAIVSSATRSRSARLTAFVFAFTFTLAVLVRIDDCRSTCSRPDGRLQLPGQLGRVSLLDRPRGQVAPAERGFGRWPCWADNVIESVYPRRLPIARTRPMRRSPAMPCRASPPSPCQTAGTAWSWLSTSRDSCTWPARRLCD